MAGKLPGNPSQDTNAREIPSVHMPKEPQCLTRKWYFSRQEIEDHSPSRKDGIQYEEESQLRKLYCSFLQELGKKLNVPQLTIATALMLCHRFYIRQSHAKNDWQTIATVSMFLACKAEETPCWLNDVAVVAYKLMYRWDPSAPRRIRQKDVFDKHKELILIGERLLLSTIAFDLNIEHPYKPLVAALKRLDILNKELAGLAWNFVNDWLRTTLCLQYKPHYIAAGSMFLAAKYAKVKLPTEKGKVWWMQFDVLPKQLEEVIQQMLGLLEKNRKQALPPMRGKVIESKPAVVKAMPNIPQSAIISGSNVAQYMGHGATVDTGGFDKSATSNSPQSCIMSSSNVAADYSGHGAMMDAGGRVESAISSTPQSCITSCSNVAQDTTVHGATMDAGGRIEPAVSSTPQSCIVSWSNVAQDTGHGAAVDTEGLVKSEMSKCNENEASSDFHVCMKESSCCQTSDCGSANSVVEDGGGEPKAGKSDQNSSSKIVSDQGSDGKININRIREALKKRRWERTVNKKLGEAMDDEIDSEAWIERELENGIEVETASVNKRRKF